VSLWGEGGDARGGAEGGRMATDRDAGSCLGGRLGVSTAQSAGFIHVESNGISPSSFLYDDRGPFELSRLGVECAEGLVEVRALPPGVSSGVKATSVCLMG
jgi:hypothetical protein